jgi:hypothetical protein
MMQSPPKLKITDEEIVLSGDPKQLSKRYEVNPCKPAIHSPLMRNLEQ